MNYLLFQNWFDYSEKTIIRTLALLVRLFLINCERFFYDLLIECPFKLILWRAIWLTCWRSQRGYLINSFTGFCIVIQIALRFVIIAHCKRAESLQQTRIFHESMREAGQDNSLDLWPLWSSHNLRVQQPHYRIIRYDWHNAHFISCLLSPFLRRYFIARYLR